MQSVPLVSILIPTYRRPKELCRALESVVAQTYPNLEIFISNNDCEDGETDSLCRDWAAKDRRIVYHVQPVNVGGCPNTGFLMKAAKGEYSFITNDDDWMNGNFIELLVRTLQEDPQCIMTNGEFVNYSENNKPFSTYSMDDVVHENSEERMRAAACLGGLAIHCLYRTRIIQENGFHELFTKAQIGLSWITYLEMAFLGTLRHTPGAVYHKSIPSNRTAAYYADFTNLSPDADIHDELLLNLVDSILHDPFYNDKLDRRDRLRLALQVGIAKGAEEKLSGVKYKYITGFKECFSYLWRHPLALFKAKASVALKISSKRIKEN